MRIVTIAGALSLASPLAAQHASASLEAAAVHVSYPASGAVTATSLAPAFEVSTGQTTFRGAGTLSSLSQGAWMAQGALAGSFFTPAFGRLRLELSSDAGGSAHEDGVRTGRGRVLGRMHVAGDQLGGWLGGGIGRTWDGSAGRGTTLGEAGVWSSAGPITLLGVVTPVVVGGDSEGAGGRTTYTDAEGTARWVRGRAELSAYAGVRWGMGATASASESPVWGGISGSMRVVGPLAIVAGVGSYPMDVTQGFPGGRFVSAGLRLTALRATARAGRAESPTPPSALPRGGITEFSVSRSGSEASDNGELLVRIQAPRAQTVELTGDLTNWQALPLVRSGAHWVVRLSARPGVHEVTVRVDGGAWLVPPGLTEVRDEFGGSAGLMVVP